MRRGLRILLIVVLGLFALAVVALVVAYRATQHVPDFYRAALEAEPAAQAEAARAMERQLLSLHNDARREGRWRADFSEDQINGWLAVKAPADVPDMLPAGLSEPRVQILAGGLRVACRADRGRLHSVLSLRLEISSPAPGQVALRICEARAGALPWPVEQVYRGISDAAQRVHRLHVERQQVDGDPVALLWLPPIDDHGRKVIRIEQVWLEPGVIHFSGTTMKEGAGG